MQSGVFGKLQLIHTSYGRERREESDYGIRFISLGITTGSQIMYVSLAFLSFFLSAVSSVESLCGKDPPLYAVIRYMGNRNRFTNEVAC